MVQKHFLFPTKVRPRFFVKPLLDATTDAVPAPGQKFLDAFGDQGAVWFAQGKTFEEARDLYIAALEKTNGELREKVDRLEAERELGLPAPVDFDDPTAAGEKKITKRGKQLGSEALAKAEAQFAAQRAQ